MFWGKDCGEAALAGDDGSLTGASAVSADASGFTLPGGAPGNEDDGLAAAAVSSWDAPLEPDATELLPAEPGGALACSAVDRALSSRAA